MRLVYYCAVYSFCTNQAGFSNKSAIHNSRLMDEASDWEFCSSQMEITNFLDHQSKLLVLAKGEEADERVDLERLGYAQAEGLLGNDGVEGLEGGDGGPLAEAVDLIQVPEVPQVLQFTQVLRRDSVVAQIVGGEGLTEGHRHGKNLQEI